MKGLIERPEWMERILHHGKAWDIRGTPTSKVGERVALVRGHATLAACLPVDAAREPAPGAGVAQALLDPIRVGAVRRAGVRPGSGGEAQGLRGVD